MLESYNQLFIYVPVVITLEKYVGESFRSFATKVERKKQTSDLVQRTLSTNFTKTAGVFLAADVTVRML